MSRVEKGSTKLRVGLAAVVGLACVGFGMVAWGGSDDPQRRTAAPEDPSSAEKVVLSHDDSAPVPTGPVKERKLRAGRAALHPDDGRAVHARPRRPGRAPTTTGASCSTPTCPRTPG